MVAVRGRGTVALRAQFVGVLPQEFRGDLARLAALMHGMTGDAAEHLALSAMAVAGALREPIVLTPTHHDAPVSPKQALLLGVDQRQGALLLLIERGGPKDHA